jgi:hypothetical protein
MTKPSTCSDPDTIGCMVESFGARGAQYDSGIASTMFGAFFATAGYHVTYHENRIMMQEFAKLALFALIVTSVLGIIETMFRRLTDTLDVAESVANVSNPWQTAKAIGGLTTYGISKAGAGARRLANKSASGLKRGRAALKEREDKKT